MVDHLRYMPEYFEAVRARLMKGAIAYGDRSFSARPEDLIEELKQEALDLAGWGYVLFCRLQAMQEALEASARASSDAVARMRTTADQCDCGAAQNWLSAIDRAEDASPFPRGDESPAARADTEPPRRMVGAERCG